MVKNLLRMACHAHSFLATPLLPPFFVVFCCFAWILLADPCSGSGHGGVLTPLTAASHSMTGPTGRCLCIIKEYTNFACNGVVVAVESCRSVVLFFTLAFHEFVIRLNSSARYFNTNSKSSDYTHY